MLEEIKQEWQVACANQKFLKTTETSIVSIIKFRGVDITLIKSLSYDQLRLPQEQRRWKTELFVESTGKTIPTAAATQTQKFMSILIGIHPGRAHEMLVLQRADVVVRKKSRKIIEDKMTVLDNTTFTENEKAFIQTWMMNQPITARNVTWDCDLLEILAAQHHYVTSRGLIEEHIDLQGHDKFYFQQMYRTAVGLMSRVRTNEKGQKIISLNTLNYWFLAPRTREQLSTSFVSIYAVRMFYETLYNKTKNVGTHKFIYMLGFLMAYYERVTGVPIDVMMKKAVESFNSYVEKKTHKQIYSSGGAPSNGGPIDVISVGKHKGSDTFGNIGDIVDELTGKISEKPNNYKSRKDKKKRYAVVSDGTMHDVLDKPYKNRKKVIEKDDLEDTSFGESEEKLEVPNGPVEMEPEEQAAPIAQNDNEEEPMFGQEIETVSFGSSGFSSLEEAFANLGTQEPIPGTEESEGVNEEPGK